MDFPTLFYRTPGVHSAGGVLTYDCTAVADDAQAEALAAEGWFPSLVEALDADKPVKGQQIAEESGEPSARALLEAEAKRLGVSFNWKTSDEALEQRITEKRAEA